MNVGGAGEKKSSSQSSPLSPPGLVKRRPSPAPSNEGPPNTTRHPEYELLKM
jgi:hypothetical protein